METVTLGDAIPPFFVGVDVGGTSIKIGLVDNKGQTLAYSTLPTNPEKEPTEALQQVHREILRHQSDLANAGLEVARIGLGTPGTMDISNGMLLDPPNLPGWKNFPIRDELAAVVGMPVTFANDANAAAFGEYWIGSGMKHRSLVMLTLGTGVGGGIIIDGRSVVGETSHGGECGHVMIDSAPSARICSCGLRGHLEAYASATALIQRCNEALDAGEVSIMASQRSAGQEITGLTIAQAAENHDPLANRIIQETADYLAVGISIFLNTIDPSAVVLGGAMNFGGEDHVIGKQFIERVRATSRRMVLPVVADNAIITFAELGGSAGYIGAAGLAREDYFQAQREQTAQI